MFRIIPCFLLLAFAASTGIAGTVSHHCGWSDAILTDSNHIGWCWSTDEGHSALSEDSHGCGLFHLGHYDLSDEDLARIEGIISEARAEIDLILSEYSSSDELPLSGGCRCCH